MKTARNLKTKLVKCAKVARLYSVSIQSCTQNRPSRKVQSHLLETRGGKGVLFFRQAAFLLGIITQSCGRLKICNRSWWMLLFNAHVFFFFIGKCKQYPAGMRVSACPPACVPYKHVQLELVPQSRAWAAVFTQNIVTPTLLVDHLCCFRIDPATEFSRSLRQPPRTAFRWATQSRACPNVPWI